MNARSVLSTLSALTHEPPIQQPVEEAFVPWIVKDAEGHPVCPDCGSGHLLEGPQGGANVNIKCAECLARFNVSQFGGPALIQRVGEPDRAHARATRAHRRADGENGARADALDFGDAGC